ncbi:MAG: hypothetical protein PVSMB7_00880 [Chloroflexota bacterium]
MQVRQSVGDGTIHAHDYRTMPDTEDSMTRIAVVNDDADFLTLLQDTLGLEGWGVHALCEDLEAHQQLKEDQPDAVILDIRMATADNGWNLLTSLKCDSATVDIPVIVTSGIPEELRDHEHWLNEHDVGILVKPFDLDDLHRCIRTALTSGKPRCSRLVSGTRRSNSG